MGERRGEEGRKEEFAEGSSEENTQGKFGGGKTGEQVRSLREAQMGRGLDWATFGRCMGIAGPVEGWVWPVGS